ncbi:MAG: hypothetical protein JNN04_05215 [Cyclobacteriaceae bacterium]|nr:hypothetical protein [Cyclobacteriaceae bacterium]
MKARFLLLLLWGCTSDQPIVDVDPDPLSVTIAVNANLSGEEPFQNYEGEYQAIYAMGARGIQTAAPWASLNPVGTTYDLTPLTNSFFGLSKLTSLGYELIYLNIPIIAIDTRSMPADISHLPFDDPQVIQRFRAMLDAIQGSLPPEVRLISFGNEVDTYFKVHDTEWASFKTLVEDARSYLKALRPSTLVGVTTTFEGCTSTYPAEVQALNENMDFVSLTYYPLLGNGFFPKDPGMVTEDVVKMVTASQGKPLVLQEWGYPSSVALGSSEDDQAEFMTLSLDEIRKQGPSKLLLVSFFKYRDWSPAFASTITNQSVGQPFYEFMSSLGLKRHDGAPKKSFEILTRALHP